MAVDVRDRPALVTLALRRPRMTGELVRIVQHRLRGYGLEQDGAYGPRTALAVATWQHRVGAPVTGAVGPAQLQVLLGWRKVPAEWVARRGTDAHDAAYRGLSAELAVLAEAERPASLEVVPRSEWCPFPPGGRSIVRHFPGIPHVLHWFGPGKAAVGRAAGVAQVVGFARYHRFTLGWADLGYGWAILRDSEEGLCTVLEGRGRDVRGAHSGHNLANTYPGVLLLAGTDSPAPTPGQLRTLQALRENYGWGRRTGHLEWSPTTCPGPVLWPWVQAHR
jgi:peptidoglycan hydrolase-like protein with peptidoglycan-binding domain